MHAGVIGSPLFSCEAQESLSCILGQYYYSDLLRVQFQCSLTNMNKVCARKKSSVRSPAVTLPLYNENKNCLRFPGLSEGRLLMCLLLSFFFHLSAESGLMEPAGFTASQYTAYKHQNIFSKTLLFLSESRLRTHRHCWISVLLFTKTHFISSFSLKFVSGFLEGYSFVNLLISYDYYKYVK